MKVGAARLSPNEFPSLCCQSLRFWSCEVASKVDGGSKKNDWWRRKRLHSEAVRRFQPRQFKGRFTCRETSWTPVCRDVHTPTFYCGGWVALANVKITTLLFSTTEQAAFTSVYRVRLLPNRRSLLWQHWETVYTFSCDNVYIPPIC